MKQIKQWAEDLEYWNNNPSNSFAETWEKEREKCLLKIKIAHDIWKEELVKQKDELGCNKVFRILLNDLSKIITDGFEDVYIEDKKKSIKLLKQRIAECERLLK